MVYDSTGSAHQEVWAPSTTGAQGWAHPIDGWAASSAVVGCAVRRETTSGSGNESSMTSSSAADTSNRPSSGIVSSAKNKVKKASGGVIAGAVLGALVALAAILGLVLLLLRRRKRAKQNAAAGEPMSQSDDGTLHQVEGTQIHQKDGDDARVEVDAVAATAELDSSRRANAHEMGTGTERVSELPAGNDGGAERR